MCSKEQFKRKSPMIDRLRAEIRTDHKSIRTEAAYVFWVSEFIFWANLQNPQNMGDAEVGAFLTYLAENNYSKSSGRVALNAINYLYVRVLKHPLGKLHFAKSSKPVNVPDVLSRDEMAAVLQNLSGDYLLLAKLLYGTGMRLMEALQLRIKDVDFKNGRIVIRDAKHGSDRVAPLPKVLSVDLRHKIECVRGQHAKDLKSGYGSVWLPDRIARKYPKAEFQTQWQYVFPSATIARDPRSGVRRRHHLFPSGLQGAIKLAAAKAGITKRVSPHVLRHSFASHCLETGTSITQVQKLLGHKSVETTMTYLHCIDNSRQRSPLDSLMMLTH